MPARLRAKADCELACLQLAQFIGEELPKADIRHFKARAQVIDDAHKAFLKEAEDEEAKPSPTGLPTVPGVLSELRRRIPKNTTILSEAISNYRKLSASRLTQPLDRESTLTMHHSSGLEAPTNRHSRPHVHQWRLLLGLVRRSGPDCALFHLRKDPQGSRGCHWSTLRLQCIANRE